MRNAIVALASAIALCFAMAGAHAQEAPGRDVESLLAYARVHNPEYAGMRYEAEAVAQREVPAGALPDPKFRTELRDITKMETQNATLAPNRVGSTRYLLMQDVPWFGKRDLKREVAELETQSARARTLETWADVAVKIKTEYAQRYYLDRSEDLVREILDLMARLERIAQVRYAGGLAAQQDVIRAQVEQTRLRNELLVLTAEHHHTAARLNALLSRPSNALLAAPAALRPLPAVVQLDVAALEDRARTTNPLLSAAASRIKAAEKSRDLAYRNRYPDFTFGVSPIQYQSAVREWEVMVEVNIPLQQSSRRAQERESEAMLSAAQARQDAAANRLQAELAENVAALDAARETAELITRALLPQAQSSFESALVGYENGRLDFATLLDAQRQIVDAKRSLVKAQAEAQVRLAEIERIVGEDL